MVTTTTYSTKTTSTLTTTLISTESTKGTLGNTNQYLLHYWPISHSTMCDTVGNADMQQGMYTNFTADRFGCPNSALNLNGGYTYVPAGVYFDTPQVTISVWIYPQSVGSWSRVIDFGNGAKSDNIVLNQASRLILKPEFHIYRGSIPKGSAASRTSLALSQWEFLVATFNGSQMSIYINGVLNGTTYLVYSLPTLNRTKNYIGKSNWASDGYSSSYLDDLRFYNKSLSQSEIYQLMNENSKQVFFQ